MATANVTGTPAAQGFLAAHPGASETSELEKISCSLASFGDAELLGLRGKRIRVLQNFGYLPVSRFVAQVMAVHLPASGSGIETSVLLREDGHSIDQLDYVDVTQLTLLEVFPDSAPAS